MPGTLKLEKKETWTCSNAVPNTFGPDPFFCSSNLLRYGKPADPLN